MTAFDSPSLQPQILAPAADDPPGPFEGYFSFLSSAVSNAFTCANRGGLGCLAYPDLRNVVLEIWFSTSPEAIPDSPAHAPAGREGRHGLRRVTREVWEDMLDLVKCKVLSVIEGEQADAYLLSESSLFVSTHRIILKTCGTTTLLLGLPRILEIASQWCGLDTVWRCFYSRKSFMFPERQRGPHRAWEDEVGFLDGIFENGSAYTVGKVNGDHWLLYLTTPTSDLSTSFASLPPPSLSIPQTLSLSPSPPDTTLEILMTHLSPAAMAPFFCPADEVNSPSGHGPGQALSASTGIASLFPEATLDAYLFHPCGYSANALWGPGDRYFTIHVTPEEGWSYASFECNVPIGSREQLKELVRKVIDIFQPGRISMTLFVGKEEEEKSAVSVPEFGSRLLRGYVRKDKIGYEFEGYDLAYACYEREGQIFDKPRAPGLKELKAADEGLAAAVER